MPTLELSHATMFYLEHKPENSVYPPLVLMHGAGGSRHDWPVGLQQLPATRVLTLDWPGHGDSPGPGCADTLEYAHIVCDLLDALGIERAIFAGHSMGGAIAQQIGIHMPARAAGLILVGTGSKLPVEPTLTQRIMDDHTAAAEWLTQWSWGVEVSDAVKAEGCARLLAVAATVLHDDYIACQAFDARPHLEQITAPTLVLGSDADRMMNIKFSVTLAERIPHAQLVTLEGAGHNFPLERADDVIAAIQTWLAAQTWSA